MEEGEGRKYGGSRGGGGGERTRMREEGDCEEEREPGERGRGLLPSMRLSIARVEIIPGGHCGR